MKQYLWAKVIAGLLALGALLYGVSIMDSDPQLRVMQEVNISDIEAGQMPREGQRVRLLDVWLLPTWVVEYSHSRKRGDHAHVTVGLGSRETLARASSGQPVDVKLWLRLPQDFKTREGAKAAMSDDALYLRQQPREGVINALPSSVRENIKSGGHMTSTATMRLEEGATPSSQGDGVGFLAAGVLALLLVAAWVAADYANQGWLQGLAANGSMPFQGASRWLLAYGVALIGAPLLTFFVASVWVDAQQLDGGLVAIAVALLALAGFALWRHRVAFVVTPQGMERAGRSGTRPLLRWDEVDALSLAQRNFRGSVSVTYTLHAGERKAKVGNSLFAGGVHRYQELGQLLRDEVNHRVAPPLLAKLAGGARVAFGALGAHRDGLVKGRLETGDVLPWDEIDSANFANGKLKIKRRGKLLAWDTVALGKMRNPDVLMQLIAQRGLSTGA
jgi:hypothetical protein